MQMASHITHRCHIVHPVTPLHILMFTLCLPVFSAPTYPDYLETIPYISIPLFSKSQVHKPFMWQQFGPADTQWVVNVPDPLSAPSSPPDTLWEATSIAGAFRALTGGRRPLKPCHQDCACSLVFIYELEVLQVTNWCSGHIYDLTIPPNTVMSMAVYSALLTHI